MVLIVDGKSEIGAHGIGHKGYLIALDTFYQEQYQI